MAALVPAAAPDRTLVLLRLACANLPKLDWQEESAMVVRVLMRDQTTAGAWKLVGATESLKETSPNFAKPVSMQYIFEQNQYLRFECAETCGTQSTLIGHVECTLGDIIGSRKSKLLEQLILDNTDATPCKDHPPTITITAEEEISGSEMYNVSFKFRGEKLDKKDLFGKSDPLLEIYRCDQAEGDTDTDEASLIYRSEYVKQELNPVWNEFELSTSSLCRNDEHCPLILRVWDWNKSGKFSYIGEVAGITLARLRTEKRFDLEKRKKKKSKSGDSHSSSLQSSKHFYPASVSVDEGGKPFKISGVLHLDKLDFKRQHTFLDYLTHGLQVNLVIGIDYTGSNGVPSRPQSLHHLSEHSLNPYQKAISSVSSILLQYDYDGVVPVYGFGGLMPNRETSHCFAVNQNASSPGVVGVTGILEAYKNSFNWVKLDGPTNFAPLVRKALEETLELEATFNDGILGYMVLLIVTDGEICDMEETVAAIIDASAHAMSIIIVGVGKGPFDNMVDLDSDDELLTDMIDQNKHAQRDIVQFVHFEPFADDPARLAAEVLEEIPTQVTSFFASRGIAPLKQ